MVLVDPLPATLETAIATAVHDANKRYRVRCLSVSLAKSVFPLLEAAEESIEYSGGTVATSYLRGHGRRSATTSWLGLVWFTDHSGRRHIRLYSDRLTCSSNYISHGWPCYRSQLGTSFGYPLLVYPVLDPGGKTYRAVNTQVTTLERQLRRKPCDAKLRAMLIMALRQAGEDARAYAQETALALVLQLTEGSYVPHPNSWWKVVTPQNKPNNTLTQL